MKTVAVAAAAILRDGRVLLCRRGSGEMKGLWEFPGGKRERGETDGDTVVREIREELRMEILPCRLLCHVGYDYPAFRLEMDVYTARILSGEPVLTEHEGLLWADREALDSVAFCPADAAVVPKLKEIPAFEWTPEKE